MESFSRKGLIGSVVAIVLMALVAVQIAFPFDFLPALNRDGFKLGLDLQGGAQLVFEADMSQVAEAERADALEGVRDVIERRVNAFGVSEPLVQTTKSGGHHRVIVELAGVFDIADAVNLIGETPILEFKLPATDLQTELTAEQEEQMETAQEAERAAAEEVLEKALDGEFAGTTVYVGEDDELFGELVKEIKDDRIREGMVPGVYESGSDLFVVRYAGVDDGTEVQARHILICHEGSERCEATRSKEKAKELADKLASEVTAETFASVAQKESDDSTAVNGGDLGWFARGEMTPVFEETAFGLENGAISGVVETPFGYHIIQRIADRKAETERLILEVTALPLTTATDLVDLDEWENTGLSGKQVQSASVAFDQQTGTPFVVLSFNKEGSDLFGTLTSENVGNVIGIFLDGEVISTPTVQQAIYGGEATIQGGFTIQEARTLAQRLNAGALPVPVELISQQTVGPSLGQASLDMSVKAAFIGFAALAVFMIAYYRLAGFIAIISLSIYAALNLAIYKLLGVTLSLSGIAGFILSLGIAVDANVLIFERLKEELASGRDLPTAIDEGFRRAWTSIRDGNFTTLIASAVLFMMSTSFIKGFALTLGIGVTISMFTAIVVTRILLKFIVDWKIFKHVWLYNGKSN